jgi:DNA-binding transcriptional regulator YiaG
MPNVEKALKAEIARISRKEIKTAIGHIAKSHTNLKKTVTDLRKRVTSLEKENKRLLTDTRRQMAQRTDKAPEEAGKARLTAKGIRSLRNRLRLTQADFAKLARATTHAVYLWEKKEGPLKLRDKTRESLLSIRGLGAKEASARLEEIEASRKRRRSIASRKRKRS